MASLMPRCVRAVTEGAGCLRVDRSTERKRNGIVVSRDGWTDGRGERTRMARGDREQKKKNDASHCTAVQRGRERVARRAPDARDRERAALVVEAIQQLRGRVQDGVVLIHELVPDDARRRARRPGGAGRRRRRRRRRGRRRGRHRDRTIDGAGGSVRSRWCLVGDALACRDGRIRGRTGAGRARQGGRGEGVDGGAARARRRRSAARAPRRRPRSIDRREEREARTDGRTDASERRGDAGGTASRSRRRAVDVAKDASTRRDERRNRSGDDRAAGRPSATRAARRPRASRRRRRSASKILRDERIERISSRRASLAAPGGHRATFAAHLGASVRAARTAVRGARVA